MKLFEAIKALSDAGIENAAHDARALFERIGGVSKGELVFRDTESNHPALSEAIRRRAAHEPLQYVIGEVDFYNESYKVTPACLIPRADTEVLVDYAVKNIPSGKRFLDLCTGSGCVAVSTLKNTDKTTAVAVDKSLDALLIAKENAERNGVCDRIDLFEKDILKEKVSGAFFALLSNPPYVTEDAYRELSPEIFFEPSMAFLGGKSGLIFYERIISDYKDSLEEGGFMALEIGYDQAESVKSIAEQNGFFAEVIKDFSGNDRVVVLKKA